MSINFDNLMLTQIRLEAKTRKVQVPNGIVAFNVGRDQYSVQADPPYNFDHYFSATSAAEAKTKFIASLIDKEKEEHAK